MTSPQAHPTCRTTWTRWWKAALMMGRSRRPADRAWVDDITRLRKAPANLPRAIPIEVTDRLSSVSAEDWNRLVGEDDPFLEHAFLAALEQSGSIGRRAGAMPRFVLVREGERLVGALPLYLKTNSYGEFIFDWAWAGGAERAGIPYYPKLVAAIPFTPATGRRFLVAPDAADADDVRRRLLEGAHAVADEERASSIHVLFCTDEEAAWLDGQPSFHRRLSMQFHWKNRSPLPYGSYDDFLGEMKSRHRKQLRHEREVATSHGLTLRTMTGTEMDDATWGVLRDFYDANADKHGAHRYLTRAFFEAIRATYAHRLVSTLAFRGDTAVAGTINF